MEKQYSKDAPELVIYDATISHGSGDKPTIIINKTGAITVNRQTIIDMGLREGDKIIFAKDKKRPRDWYIKTGNSGFKLRYSASKSMIFSCKPLANIILSSIESSKTREVIPVSNQPNANGWHALITANVR